MQYWTLAEHFAYVPLGTANKVPLGDCQHSSLGVGLHKEIWCFALSSPPIKIIN